MTNPISSLIVGALAAVVLAACVSPDGSVDSVRMDCFEADRITSWESHDGRTLDVTDVRGDHFRIHFCSTCPGLRDPIAVGFEGDVDGLMCGDEGETVDIRGKSCRVSSVMRVSPQAEELDVTSCD